MTGPVCPPGASENATEKTSDCPRAMAPGPADRQAVLGPQGRGPQAGSAAPVVTKQGPTGQRGASAVRATELGISGKMGRMGGHGQEGLLSTCQGKAASPPLLVGKKPALVSG